MRRHLVHSKLPPYPELFSIQVCDQYEYQDFSLQRCIQAPFLVIVIFIRIEYKPICEIYLANHIEPFVGRYTDR